MTITQPMTNEQYHADTSRISKSGVDEINRSPAHYYNKYLDPNRLRKPPTEAFRRGSIFHKLVLEPDDFKNEYVILPASAPAYPTETQWKAENPSKETRQAIEFWRQLTTSKPNHTMITIEEYELAQRMRDAVMRHTSARELFELQGVAEETILFTDPDTGAPCKCRPDWRVRQGIIVDLKSTKDASPEAFGRAAYNYRYHVQSPFYVDGTNASFGHEAVQEFVFVAVESEPPYGVGVYFIGKEDMELGRRDYKRNLATYVACKESGIWPAYSQAIEPLRIPTWAHRVNS